MHKDLVFGCIPVWHRIPGSCTPSFLADSCLQKSYFTASVVYKYIAEISRIAIRTDAGSCRLSKRYQS